MRALVGIALDGQVTEFSLPDQVPLAHLLPEVFARLGSDGDRLHPRRADGAWLDLERSLSEQNCRSGSLICLEDPARSEPDWHHDPVVALAERGPPLDLIPTRAAVGIVGGLVGAWISAGSAVGSVALVAVAPVAWAALPALGAVASVATVGLVQEALQILALGFGAAALAASGPAAATGQVGVALDSCVAGALLVHVIRAWVANPLGRVILGAAQWWLLGAVVPLAAVAAGWRW